MRVFVGHPVDVVTGGVFTAWNDFAFTGRTPVAWRRFYTTGNPEVSAHGLGWTTEYFARLERRGSKIVMTGDEGHAHAFDEPVDDSPSRVPLHGWDLYRADRGFRVFDRSHGRTLHFTSSLVRPQVFLLRQIEEISGHSLYLHYGHDTRLIEIEQRSLQRRIVFSYTHAGVIDRAELAIVGRAPELLARFAYDERLNLIAAQDPCGGIIRYAYDQENRLVKETNKLGASFHFEYDTFGRCTRTWGDGGYLERRLVYHADRRMTEVTDSTGAIVQYAYDAAGMITSITNALGHVSRVHRRGGVEQRVNAAGFVTETEVNDRGELVRRTNELGRSFLFTYNERSQILAITDPGGAVWTREYDDRGLLSALGDPAGRMWRLERGPTGDVVAQIDPEGRRLRRRYDPLMRWQEIADDVGYCRFEYDVFGRAVISANADGLINAWAYDAAGRLIRTTYADGSFAAFEYDANGNLVTQRDESGAVWSFTYDGFGHLLSARDPLGGVVRIQYDSEGRRTKVYNQLGELYEDQYDAAGRVIARTYFDGRTEQYARNVTGGLSSITRAGGVRLDRTYDAAGNMVGEQAIAPTPDGEGSQSRWTSTFQYDWRGWITRATNETCDVTFEYDAIGRLVREQQDRFGIQYRYDGSGKLTRRTVEGGSAGDVTFGYNTAGLLESIADGRGLVESYAYDRAGAIRRRWMRDQYEEQLTYDARHRVSTQTVTKTSGPIVSRAYRFDARDSLVELTEQHRTVMSFDYDAARRLTRVAKNGSQTDAFHYDVAGNIVAHNSTTWRYGAGGRLASRGTTSYSYDAAGNQIGVDDASARRGQQREYDPYGRLVAVSAGGTTIATYGYDALNRRVWKTDATRATSRYIWANRALAAVASDDGETSELLLSSKDRAPSVLWRDGKAEHYICNHIGVPREVISERWGTVWQSEYAPFGRATVTCDDPCPAYDVRLPGQIEDRESGLFYNWHRYYDPDQSRYVTPDPAGIDAGINLYDYPRDPINWTDPWGLSCPNPRLVEENTRWGWQVHEHTDGTLTITADCTRGFTTPKPYGLRPTIHAGSDNAANFPEAHLGQDGRLIVMEGTHRSVAAARGQQMPPDPDNPHLGGVPNRPGHMTYFYSPEFNDDEPGVPLSSLSYPPGYPHTL